MIKISNQLSELELKLKNLRERIKFRLDWAASTDKYEASEVVLAHVKKNIKQYGGLAAMAVAMYRQENASYENKSQEPYNVQLSKVG